MSGIAVPKYFNFAAFSKYVTYLIYFFYFLYLANLQSTLQIDRKFSQIEFMSGTQNKARINERLFIYIYINILLYIYIYIKKGYVNTRRAVLHVENRDIYINLRF
jgi:hypothetical protein